MKQKLTLLILALIVSMGAWAEKYYRTNGRVTSLSTGTKYMIYNTSHTGYDKRFYLYGDGTAFSVKKPTVVGSPTNIVTDNKYIWTLEESASPGEYYLKNENSGKYYNGSTSTLGDTPVSMVFTRWDNMEAEKRGGDANSEAEDGSYRKKGEFNDATDVWGIQISGGNYFNGNDGALVMWGNGHPFAIYAVEEIDGTAITYGADQGTCFNTSQRIVTSGWAGTWISTADPSVLIKSTTNNISPETSQNGKLHANNITYTVSVGSGYTIDSYRIIGRSGDATNVNIKVGEDVKCTFTNSKDADVLITVNASSATFTLTGGSSKFLVPSSFVFYVKGSATGDNVQALSQLSNSKCYYIKSADPNEYSARQDFCINNSNDGVSATINDNTSSNRETANKKQFAIISYEGNYYLYSVSESKFVSNSSESFAAGDTPVLTTNPQHPIVISKGVFTDAWMIRYKSDNNNYINISSKLVKLIAAGSSDYGTYLRLVVADDFDATTALAALNTEAEYTYKVYHGSPLTYSGYSASTVQEKGATPSIPALLSRFYCTYSYYSDAACETPMATLPSSAATVYVKYTFAPPFTVSADYASATWYYLTLKGNYFVSNGADTYPIISSDMVTGEAGQWAFLGNPYSGVQVINKALDGYYLQDTESKPTMTTTASNWVVVENSDKFVLKSSTGNYIDAFNNSLGYYGSIDGNQNFTATLVSSNYYSWLTANVTPFFTAGSDYFYLDSEKSEYSAVKTIYDEAVLAETCTEANYNTLVSYVKTLDNYILPPTGYYRLKNYMYPTYYMNAETTSPNGISYTTAGTVVYLTKTDNTYTMQMQGSYLQTPATNAQVGLSGSSVTFTPSVGKAGWASFNAGGNNFGNLHMNGSKNIVGWSAFGIETNKASYWEVEDVTSVTVAMHSDGAEPATYSATFCAPFSYTVSGAKAYTLTKSGNVLTPTEVPGAVPAGTPVLLEGTSSTATLTISGTDYAATPLTSDLTGTYLAKTINGGNDYVLGINGGVVGFYHWNSNNLGANRAYIVGGGGSVKGYVLSFDDEPDAIKTLSDSPLKGENIYNLAGQRISKMQKGINIVNGKKIMVK